MTLTETNNNGYKIEQRSKDAWNKIGFVQGRGTSTEPESYSFTDKPGKVGTYYYRLKQLDFNGDYEYSGTVEVSLGEPGEYKLSQNYPNPFNPTTTINYTIPADGFINLSIYNPLGQKAAELINGTVKAGSYRVDFNAAGLSSGVYYYRLEADGYRETKKMILLR